MKNKNPAGVVAPKPDNVYIDIETHLRSNDSGLKSFCDHVDRLTAKAKESKRKQDAILAELGFKLTFEDVIALLKDEERLKKVVSKLKMKAFW